MKKSSKIEVVLSSNQLQAARMNKVEYQRFQHNLKYLEGDYHGQIARLQREQQGLKYHFKNVVRIVKPNRAFQLWKQAHAYELAQDEASLLKLKSRSHSRKQTMSTTNELPTEPLRPLLLLVENETKKVTIDPLISISDSFLRPKTSYVSRQTDTQHRTINPILNMLSNRPISSHLTRRSTQQYDSPSYSSLPTNSRRARSTQRTTTTTTNLDTLYRLALQNQTAYKSIDQNVVEDRKLHDKEFASRYRALKGSVRSSGLVS